jgi:hypothetical protein
MSAFPSLKRYTYFLALELFPKSHISKGIIKIKILILERRFIDTGMSIFFKRFFVFDYMKYFVFDYMKYFVYCFLVYKSIDIYATALLWSCDSSLYLLIIGFSWYKSLISM